MCAFGTFYLDPDHLQHVFMQVSISTNFTNEASDRSYQDINDKVDYKAVK